MRPTIRSIAWPLLAGMLVGVAGPAQTQALSANYALTAPSVLSEPEWMPRGQLASWGSVRLAAARSSNGSGLSLEAGEHWFARAGVGRSLHEDVVSVGGGYRFAENEAVSMHVTRQLGQERLGLAVRYDWQRSYLRLSYEMPARSQNAPDRLRFSAGVRF